MATITTQDDTRIYYKDWGSGQPVVFSHGWPLSADAWDDQMLFLGERGYRVIAHDRRGHGGRASPGSATTWTPMRTPPRRWWKRSTEKPRSMSPTRGAGGRSPVTSAVTARSG